MTTFKAHYASAVDIDAIGLFNKTSEPAWDRVTKAITQSFDIPVSILSVIDVDGDRQFFKSQVGLQDPWKRLQETPLSHSFCQYVVATNAPLVVPDARENSLVSCNLAIRDLGVVAYLGVPVFGPDEKCVAALCAIDSKPRSWEPEEVELLCCLADGISAGLHVRAATIAGDAVLAKMAQTAA